MASVRTLAEGLARRTTRRGLFGRSSDVVFGALAGAAAGTLARPWSGATAGAGTTNCSFPGPPCECATCQSNGLCAKPCVILTTYYASGCWVTGQGGTCCDCNCRGLNEVFICGCGSDYHGEPDNCPDGAA
jgi:hypothetical protein